MLKKSMAIVLSMALLLTILPLSAVYASYPTAKITTLTSTSPSSPSTTVDGIATDDFEFDYADNIAAYVGPEGTGVNMYPKSTEDYKDKNGNVWSSEVFYGVETSKSPFKFVEDSTGNQMLQITSNGSDAYNRTRYFKRQNGQMVVFSYELCFTKFPTAVSNTDALFIGHNGRPGSISAGMYNGEAYLYERLTASTALTANNTYKPVVGKWYDVVVVIDATGEITTYLIDAETNEILLKSNDAGRKDFPIESPSYTYLVGLNFKSGVAADDCVAVMDNAELIFYTPAEWAPSVKEFSVKNNSAVSSSEDNISVTFDQTMGTTLGATITPVNGTAVSCSVTKDETKLNTYNVALPSLEAGTAYTLDVSGCKNVGNVAPASGATLSFTTEEGDIVKYTDSFDDESLVTSNKHAYNNSATTNEKSPIKTRGTDGHTKNYTYLSDGYSGKALTLETADDENGEYHYPLTTSVGYTPAVNNGEYERFVITYRFNIAAASTVNDKKTYDTGNTYAHVGNLIRIGASNSQKGDNDKSIAVIRQNYENKTDADGYRVYEDTQLYISPNGGTLAEWRPINTGKWYNVIWSINGKDQKFKLVDAQTGELVWETEREVELFTESNPAAYFNIFTGNRYTGTKTIYNANSKYLIDDFTIYRIKPWAAKHALTAQQSVSGVDTVLTFNQPTAAGAKAFELYKGEYTAGAASNTRVYQAPDVTYPDFCQQKISFDNLDYLTNYAVDYSAITAEGGTSLSASDKASAVAEFTTPAHPEAAFISSDIECSSLSAGGTITFDVYSKQSETVDIIASLHKRNYPAKLETVEKLEDVSLSAGEKTPVSITLSKNVDADYIRIFAWDGTTLTPLMSDYEALAPVDTLNVLMIGSSLSEDTGRYFDNMLQAAGYNSDTVKNIDITVKGVGGGHFTYHAANLKRELAEGLDKKYTQTEDNGAVHTYIQEQTAIMNGNADDPGDGPDETRRLYFTYENGVKVNAREDNLLVTALMEKQYDIITLQPGANYYSYAYDDYEEALSYLTTKLREIQPNAEIMLFQTWSPWYESQASRLNYFTDKIKPYMEKWAKNTADVTENVTLNGEPMKVIPSGYAFFLADTFTQWGGDKYNLDSGNSTAEAKGNELIYSNAANGLMRDYNHASFYGQYLSDAVWYETFTGKKAPVTYSNGSPVIAKPTGIGPALDADGKMVTDGTTATYFTAISDAEHIARLQMLSDIAHQVVEEYKGEFER